MKQSPYLLKAQEISKKYGSVQVLKGIDLQVKPGEIVVIMGASGAGKSTLLHIVGTLDKPDQGHLVLGGNDVLALQGNALAQFRNKHIGFIFQSHNLLPEFTALENVCLPGYIGGLNKKLVEAYAKELLTVLQLQDRLQYKPGMLSGGEQQRVAVARALVNQPCIVLADEPSGSLDSKSAVALHQLFLDIRAKFGQTFIVATHNQALAALADKTYVLEDGHFLP
jgi:lipoprotein-releasing system ATP-binding protein